MEEHLTDIAGYLEKGGLPPVNEAKAGVSKKVNLGERLLQSHLGSFKDSGKKN